MNMRKIVAMLAAVLMLCAAIPMGALSVVAAPGDVIIDADFNDGMDGFNNFSVVDGALVIDGASADWANSYAYASAIKPSTKYVVTGRAKADAPQTLYFKINNGWSGTNVSEGAELTTEWTEFELFLTPDANLVEPIFTIQTGTYASGGTTFYIDWVKVAEYEEPTVPGTIINGNFENGSEGWALSGSASIENGALKLDNPSQWSEAALQTISVKANTVYEITWKSQRVSGEGTFNLIAMNGDNANLEKVSGQNWMNEISGEWVYNTYVINTGDSEAMKIKFTTEAVNPGVILIDNIAIVEVKEGIWHASFNNGNQHFKTGELVAEGPDGSDCFKWTATGGWSSTYTSINGFTPNTDYIVTFKAKGSVAAGMGITIEDGNWGNYTNVPGFNVTTDWAEYVVAFNSSTHPNEYGSILFKFQDVGVAMDLYVDDIVIAEGQPEPVKPVIVNGDFETGEIAPWVNLWGSSTVEIVEGRDGGYALKGTGNGAYHIVYQEVNVTPNTNYTVEAYAKDVSNSHLWIKSAGGAANIVNKEFASGSDWSKTSVSFNSGDNTSVWVGLMALSAGATYTVDDVTIFETEATYIVNGDLETGEIDPWNNLWGSCPTVEIVEGMDGGSAMHIVSKKWCHVRQTNIAVEANTWYKVTVWAKNTSNMCLLVKNNDDNYDIINKPVTAGDEWTELSIEFNTGEFTSIIFSLMGGEGEDQQEGTFDNIVMEKAPCQHEYEVTTEDATCDLEGSNTYTCSGCGDTYTETIPAWHDGNLTHVPAVEAIDCAHPGNIEYYTCPCCNEYFTDANASEMINPWYIEITVDCVRPEDVADCANWTCETCGNENYGYGEHDTGVAACQDGHCSKCDQDIAGYGCANYDTPACEDGVCYYCGGFVAGFGHENGAWAPCCDGECSYGCGLTYPATAEHVDEDANDYCDTCWNHLAHIDADADGFCDDCWSEMPAVEIIYGDANGDGVVDILDEVLLSQYLAEWEVELNETAADANGDDIIDILDEVLLSQYLAEWEVTLGPDET